jgi:FixJ family two-component response regulator/predicted transcriptional regulator
MTSLYADDDSDEILISELQQDNIGGQRSKIDVVATILHICLDGSLKNHIIGKGNLSDSMTNHYLTLLLYHNLLETYKDEDNNNRTYYRTTRKGKAVILHYNEIQKLFLKKGMLSSNNFRTSTGDRYYPEKRKYPDNSTLNQYKILIIDDESDITSALKCGLQLQGFKVDVFNEPLKALSNYSVGTYNLLILDVKMPRMNGFELYKVIRKLDKGIRICFWTAFEVCYEELRRMFPVMDERYFIRKPIAMDELIDRIESIISESTETTNVMSPNENVATNQQK